MEKSGDETGNPGTTVLHKDRIERRKVIPPGVETAFTKFERLERRKQIVPGFGEAEPIPEGDKPDSTPATPSEDFLSPMLRSGSPSKPDQEHKKS